MSFEVLNWHACSVHTAQMQNSLGTLLTIPAVSSCWPQGDFWPAWAASRTKSPSESFPLLCPQAASPNPFPWGVNYWGACFVLWPVPWLPGGTSLAVLTLLPRESSLCQHGSEHNSHWALGLFSAWTESCADPAHPVTWWPEGRVVWTLEFVGPTCMRAVACFQVNGCCYCPSGVLSSLFLFHRCFTFVLNPKRDRSPSSGT